MSKRLSSLLFFNLVLLLACNPKMDLGVEKKSSITTDGAKEVSSTTAVLNGTVNLVSSAYDDIIVGFQYSSSNFLSSNSTYTEVLKQVQTPNCSYSATIIGLEPATKYYYRAFMREKEVESFGEIKEFITLAPTKVSSISLNKKTLELAEGETEPLIATITPSNSDDKSLVWSSSDETVVTVSKTSEVTAEVTAISKGTAIIKAEAQDGSGQYATCSVSVIRRVSSITLDKTSLVLFTGGAVSLSARVLPLDAYDTGVSWTSSDESIATVYSSSEVVGVITGKSPGNVIITAKSKDGSGIEASCEVEVRQYVTGISLDKSFFDLPERGQRTLSATVTPSNASDKTLTWSTDNTSVVSVDGNGVVKAMSKGNATITVSANDGSGVKAECNVEVLSYIAEAVDLGLSVKWSNMNLGATKPEEYGRYFRWGETDCYNRSSIKTYLWHYEYIDSHLIHSYKITKYCTTSSDWGGAGSPDNKKEFEDYDYVDDAARAKLGGTWRTPTVAEWTELLNNCTLQWTSNYKGTGIAGVVVKKNLKSIFLPAAGYYDGAWVKEDYNRRYDVGTCLRYWSSSIEADEPNRAILFYYDTALSQMSGIGNTLRYNGITVRPVCE